MQLIFKVHSILNVVSPHKTLSFPIRISSVLLKEFAINNIRKVNKTTFLKSKN